MVDGIVRARLDLLTAAAGLLIGLLVAPFGAMLLPLLLVLAGAVLCWQRPDSAVGLWLLRAGAALSVLTAIVAYGMHGHTTTSHVHRI
jgi:hypothetical protein